MFVAKVSSAGSFEWAWGEGTTQHDSGAHAIMADGAGGAYVVGKFARGENVGFGGTTLYTQYGAGVRISHTRANVPPVAQQR